MKSLKLKYQTIALVARQSNPCEGRRAISLKSTKQLLLLMSIIITLALLVSCAQADEPEFILEEGPLMWLVTAPDGQTMHLFGSMHAGNEDNYPLPDHIMDAFEQSDYLAVEINMVEVGNDSVLMEIYFESLIFTDGRTIIDVIGEELYQQLTDILLGFGIPAGLLDYYRPLMWQNTFNEIIMDIVGLSQEYGLDFFFIYEAMERGMDILEVEVFEEVIAMLTGFSDPLWTAMLEGYLDMDDAVDGLKELHYNWTQGNLNAIADFLNEEDDELSIDLQNEYLDAMITQRDLAMAEKAELYMSEGKNVFFVVGLAHLIGEDSVTGLLTQRGYDVQLVSGNPE
jgi:uncharacterized protein YbaP (TraB family)